MVWALIADFHELHRNFSKVFTSCETFEGEKNQVGSLGVVKWKSGTGREMEAKDQLV